MPVSALNLGSASASFDGVYYVSAYPNGDKPQIVCTAPSGYTEIDLGDAAGEICDTAGDWELTVSGTNQITDAHIAYQDAGSGDVQVEGQIQNDYSGTAESFAAVGVGIRESILDTSWVFQCHSLQNGSTAVQCMYGENGTYTTVNGSAGQSRPRYVAVTYDVSSGDIKGHASSDGSTWTEIASTNRALSDALCYAGGASRLTTESLTATIGGVACDTSIDAYTPIDPPPPTAPTLVTQIANQSAQQGTAYSLSCSANWTGATSYALTGLPASTGLSFNTSTCALTGTPSANDVGTRNLTVTATNAAGSTPDTFQFTASASQANGDVFLIATQSSTATRTFTCNNASTGANGASWSSIRTSGSGTQPGPGDTIVLDNGTHHGVFKFTNCSGSDSARINIVNDTAGNGPAIFEKSISARGTFWFSCTNCVNVNLDGRGGWNGSSGKCGVDPVDLSVDTAACGIQFTISTAGFQVPQSFVAWKGTSSKYGVYGIEINSVGGIGGGVALDCHDNGQVNGYSGTGTYGGEWIEDVTVSQNYIHDHGVDSGEGMYCGSNAGEDAWPLRRWDISYNYVKSTARECINLKYAREGPNYVRYNVIEDCSTANSGGQTRGINVTDGGDIDIYANVCKGTNGPCISHIMNAGADDLDPGDGTFYSNIYNNIVYDTAGSAMSSGVYVEDNNTATSPRVTDQIIPTLIYNNTVVNASGAAISRTPARTCTARDNVLAGTNTTVSNCTDTSNTKGTVAAQGFVNSGSNNYELTVSSPACGASTNDAVPSVDYENEARDQDGHSDDGADEATACP